MEGVVAICVPGDIPLGIEFAHSAHTGLPLIVSLARVDLKNSETPLLRTGDAITSASSIQLEPSTWEDAEVQLQKAMKLPAAPRKLNFVREHTIPTSSDTRNGRTTQLGCQGTHMERSRDILQDARSNSSFGRVMLPSDAKNESNGISMGIDLVGAVQRRQKHEVNKLPGVLEYSARQRLLWDV